MDEVVVVIDAVRCPMWQALPDWARERAQAGGIRLNAHGDPVAPYTWRWIVRDRILEIRQPRALTPHTT